MNHSFTPKRLPRHPGPAAWNLLLPPPPPAQRLEGAQTADVVVIGAGFAGLSAARRLSQLDPGLRVTVLEAGCVGEGPAGRNSGFMIDLPHDLASDDYAGAGEESDRTQTALNRLAIAFAAEAAEEYGLGCEIFDPCGKVNAAATERGHALNLAYTAHLVRLGEPYELLDAEAMRAMTGTGFYRSGVKTPGAAMIQPAAYIRALAQGMTERSNHMLVFEGSPALRIERIGGGWRVGSHSGRVDADRVILAVNGHAESFGFFRHRLLHVFTYASMTRALSLQESARLSGKSNWGVLPADPMGMTVRRIADPGGGRIVVRSRFTCNPSMEVRAASVQSAGRAHDKGFAVRFPMLKGVEMEYRWGGHLCLSLNGSPAFGEMEPGLYSACCQNGLGTVKGTLSGMGAAELAAGAPGEIARTLSAAPQPSRLPPEPFAAIGANAYMRWKEFRAAGE